MPKFNAAQRAAIEAENQNILVSAAAGSGKTTVMVEKIRETLKKHPEASMAEFLVITFTKDAARNMKNKLRDLLERGAQEGDERSAKALGEIETATISTIHSFCTQLLTEYNDNAGATSTATYVAGTFTGDCKTVVYTATIDETQEFTITMQEDSTFTLITPAITYAQMGTTIPSFTVSGMKAELATLNDVTIYQLSATNYTGEVEVDGSTKTYTVSQLSIMINKADSTAAINYTFNYGKIPFPVEVSFNGKKN